LTSALLLLRFVRVGPLIFQREIPRREEVRVTVVDDECFSVSCECSQLPDGLVEVRKMDFRENRRRFRRATGVKQIEAWSRRLARAFGLGYAGFDGAVSEGGDPYFLECNPFGSFHWYEAVGEHDITASVAGALLRRAARSA
jgi:glutathione synthase/RimK-type ligase-like ATP-grasp enzyme